MKSSGISTQKETLRKEVAAMKRTFSEEKLSILSEEVNSTLELTEVFCRAKVVLIYYSLPDEVNTRNLIQKYCKQKQFLLPVTQHGDLFLKRFVSVRDLSVSNYGIEEPQGEIFTDYHAIDLVIVPGVAFDRKLNRMGRGKGYYDRLLPKINTFRAGICFDFQLFDRIPFTDQDITMNMIISENEIVVE